MDAIAYLTEQHREIASIFGQFATAARATTKVRLCRKLVDLLAVHAAVEEMIFYPAARRAGATELLPAALEEHLSAERIVAEIVEAGAVSARAAARMALLEERKLRHAEREEIDLFPRVRELLTAGELDRVGERMSSVADQLLEPGAGARERVTARRALA